MLVTQRYTVEVPDDHVAALLTVLTTSWESKAPRGIARDLVLRGRLFPVTSCCYAVHADYEDPLASRLRLADDQDLVVVTGPDLPSIQESLRRPPSSLPRLHVPTLVGRYTATYGETPTQTLSRVDPSRTQISGETLRSPRSRHSPPHTSRTTPNSRGLP